MFLPLTRTQRESELSTIFPHNTSPENQRCYIQHVMRMVVITILKENKRYHWDWIEQVCFNDFTSKPLICKRRRNQTKPTITGALWEDCSAYKMAHAVWDDNQKKLYQTTLGQPRKNITRYSLFCWNIVYLCYPSTCISGIPRKPAGLGKMGNHNMCLLLSACAIQVIIGVSNFSVSRWFKGGPLSGCDVTRGLRWESK